VEGILPTGAAGMTQGSPQLPAPGFMHLTLLSPDLLLARDAQPLLPKGEGAAAKGSRELAAFLQKLL